MLQNNFPTCSKASIKYGRTKNGAQRFRCRHCSKTFLKDYRYGSYKIKGATIICLLKEGCGIRSIARILKISVTTVLSRIKAIAACIKKPVINIGKEYELDEMCTFIKRKTRLRWIVYAIDRATKSVTDFTIGRRTNTTLQKVADTLLLSDARRIYTDKLRNYASILPPEIHSTKYRSTNHIERKNLTIRTHLKRLSRRTICFSKSLTMLNACLKIYFWAPSSSNKVIQPIRI